MRNMIDTPSGEGWANAWKDGRLKILHDGHPMLRETMPAIDPRSIPAPGARGVARAMEEAMKAADGIGLAANQVGLPLRAFSIRLQSGLIATLFNPEIRDADDEVVKGEEGCLSFPGLKLEVRRSSRVDVIAQDPDGRTVSMSLRGVDAICAQHEIDHLDGIVFTTRVSRLALQMARRRLSKEERRRR